MKRDLVDIALTVIVWGTFLAVFGLSVFAVGVTVGWFG